MAIRTLGIVAVVACSVGVMGASTTALKPFDPVALQATVEAMGKELLLPGAMVLLRTKQGDFAFGYGATELGRHHQAARRHSFQGRLEYQDHDRRRDRAVWPKTANCVSTIRSRNMFRAFPTGTTSPSASSLKCGAACYNYTSAPELADSLNHDPTRVWTPEDLLAIAFKRSASCSLRARNTTIATPIMSCSD